MSKFYDVVIYEIETGIIDAITGKCMAKSTGFYNAHKRLETTLARINNRYYAKIVPTGTYKKGDKIND
jgi:hypothetical protein